MKKEIMSHTGRNSSTMSHFIWVIFTLSVLLLQNKVSTQGTTQAPGGTPVPVGGGSPDAGIAVTTLMPGSQTVGTVAPGPNAAGPDGSNLLSQLTPDDGFALMPTATDYIPPGPAPTSPPPTTTTVPTTTTPTTTTTQAPTTTEAPTTTTTTTTTTRPPPLPFTQPPIMEPVGGPRWTGGNYHLGPGNQGLPYTQPHVPNNKNIWNYKPPGPGRPMNMDWMWLLLMNHEA